MLIAAFVSAFNMRPHWVQWNTAWLSRFSLHVWPHWLHCWLVYAGFTSRRLLAYAKGSPFDALDIPGLHAKNVNVVLFVLWIVFADVLSAISGSC